jgi:hypothetical protein
MRNLFRRNTITSTPLDVLAPRAVATLTPIYTQLVTDHNAADILDEVA